MRISYSRLSTYLNCQKQYQYQYLLREDPTVKKDASDEYHAYLGSMTQYIFEMVTNNKIYTKTNYINFVEVMNKGLLDAVQATTYDMYSPKPQEVSSKFYKDLQVMQIDFTAHTSYEIVEEIQKLVIPNLDIYWNDKVMGPLDDIICEQEISFEDETPSGIKYSVVGFIDFLVKDRSKNDLLTIIDGKKNYKPTNHKPEQIGIYMIGLRDKNINPEGQFWSYNTSKFHKVQVSIDKTKAWVDNIVELATEAEDQGYFSYATNKKSCFFCAYKSICEGAPS